MMSLTVRRVAAPPAGPPPLGGACMAAVRVLACGACVSLSHAPARPLLSPQQAGGVLYVFGGSDREGTHSSALYAFDLATGSWKGEVAATGVTPPAVGGASLVAAGADLILFGGMNVADGIIIGIIHVFNTVTAVWSKPASVGDRPTPRNGHTLVNVSGRLFLFGGSSPDDGPMNDFFELILPGVCVCLCACARACLRVCLCAASSCLCLSELSAQCLAHAPPLSLTHTQLRPVQPSHGGSWARRGLHHCRVKCTRVLDSRCSARRLPPPPSCACTVAGALTKSSLTFVCWI